jgi:hypothetical protein
VSPAVRDQAKGGCLYNLQVVSLSRRLFALRFRVMSTEVETSQDFSERAEVVTPHSAEEIRDSSTSLGMTIWPLSLQLPGGFPAHDCPHCATFQFPAIKRRVA